MRSDDDDAFHLYITHSCHIGHLFIEHPSILALIWLFHGMGYHYSWSAWFRVYFLIFDFFLLLLQLYLTSL